MTLPAPWPTPRPTPRIELEEAPAQRLEAATLPLALTLPDRPAGGVALAVGGIGVLGLTATFLGTERMIAAAFAASPWLGWPTLAGGAAGAALLAWGIWREARGLWALRHVDHVRLALAGTDPEKLRDAAVGWAGSLPDGEALVPALRATSDPAAIFALLRAGPAATLRLRTDALSTTASLQILAAIAAIPAPLFDGLLVAWRGIRLVRQVAELHGLRPGLLATVALLRRTLASAALVTATDIAANTAAQMLFSNKLVAHIAGDTATALIAARRLHLLARATSVACTPLP